MKSDKPPKVSNYKKTQGADSAIHYFGSGIHNAQPAEQQHKFK